MNSFAQQFNYCPMGPKRTGPLSGGISEIWFYHRTVLWWSHSYWPFDHKLPLLDSLSNEYIIWNILQDFQVDKIQEAESVEAGDYIAWNVSGIKNK